MPVWKSVPWERDWAEESECQNWLESVRIPELQASQWSTGKEGTLLQGLGDFAGVFTPTAALAVGAWAGLRHNLRRGWQYCATSPELTALSGQMFLNKFKSKTRKGESIWNSVGKVKFFVIPQAFLKHFLVHQWGGISLARSTLDACCIVALLPRAGAVPQQLEEDCYRLIL